MISTLHSVLMRRVTASAGSVRSALKRSTSSGQSLSTRDYYYCEEPLRDNEYDAAYRRARERFGAPIPEYVGATIATDNWALV